MVVVWFGKENSDSYICDASTPATSVYCWGLDEWLVSMIESEEIIELIKASYGSTIATLGFKIDNVAIIKDIIKNSTDWLNFIKARGYWKKNNKLLYIHIENEWGVNIMQYSPYATPTTLADWRGFLTNFRVPDIKTSNIPFQIMFVQATKVISTT